MDKSISASEYTIVIVQSEFNCKIVDNLLQGAIDAYYHYNGNKSSLHVYKVPGAFEIPGTIKQIIKYQKLDAIVAIGAIIRGETPHFDYVAEASSIGIAKMSLSADIPIINGIITTDSLEQAEERSQNGKRNKGWDAMEASLQTINVYKQISSASEC